MRHKKGEIAMDEAANVFKKIMKTTALKLKK